VVLGKATDFNGIAANVDKAKDSRMKRCANAPRGEVKSLPQGQQYLNLRSNTPAPVDFLPRTPRNAAPGQSMTWSTSPENGSNASGEGAVT